ncbi:11-beta-hydroxysteroid dehydrogenase 1B-like [Papaver somniferum]|uniref:11-beta-hydroxysteroid dehydrogenase 1B-like n=1 Tax=Papaver somniferum TaxID=3469 RepID=UPI000E6FD2AB|nr:11-beta-hydroxysteroid dehydrogenase 1B-like [Papaver somniferum]
MEPLLIHKILNLFIPPIIFIILCIITPPYYLFKLLNSILIKPLFFVENMAGKVVLVTGASSGIGEQLVYEYARRKALLVIVARRTNLLEEVAKKAREFGSPDVLVVCADVTKVDDCERFIEETINYFGRLDHLVNNAGITSVCPFKEVKNILNFAPIMDVNFWGSVYPTHFAIPHLQKSKGRIVVIASVNGWLPAPRLTFYASSKAALINFYDTLRVELQPDGVKITIASPGVTDSEMSQGKTLSKEGVMQVDKDLMDGMIETFLLGMPVISSKLCAKTIVNGACRGERSITEPAYFGAFYLVEVFCPEMYHWIFTWIDSRKPVIKNHSNNITSTAVIEQS